MPAKILEAAGAMVWPMWPALAPEDSLLVPDPPPEGFTHYLDSVGLRAPHFTTVDGLQSMEFAPRKSPLFTPFGWNQAAVDQMNSLGVVAAHSDLDVVRRVNSRLFMRELERVVSGASACPATYCRLPRAVKEWVDGAPPGRYVAKGNHGLAGIGQLRFMLGEGDASKMRESVALSLMKLAARHGGVVIEEELGVVREWGVLFRVGRDGRRCAVRRHRLLAGVSGGYLGSLVLPADQAQAEAEWAEFADEAERTVDAVTAVLHREEYFGPVGLDMFSHRQESTIRFRPLVDLNARQSMAWPAHGLAARFPERALLFRQFPAKSVQIPENYAALRDKMAFDLTRRRGAIWITPLLPLTRVSLAFVGDDEADVLALHDDLIRRISP